MIEILAFIWYALLALLGFGFVIAIHEFGHFLFAKWAGVRVDVFSIGFGPVVLRRRVGETDYVLSLLPLGGYVKMLGQEDVPSGEAPAADPRSYLAKSAGWKALILLGGVLFNLVSSYLILLGLVAWGMPVFQPVVGDVMPTVVNQDRVAVESPASRLGLKRGDRLLEVNGEQVRSFDDVVTAVVFAGGKPMHVAVERGGRRLDLPAPGAAPVEPVFDGRFGRPSLGIDLGSTTRVVGISDPGDGGLQRLDRIVAIAGEDVSGLTGQELQDRLYARFLEPVEVTVLRGGARVQARLTYAGPDGAFDTRAGLPVRLVAVVPDGPAGRAGFQAGDWVVSVDGAAVCGVGHFQALIRRGIARPGGVRLTVLRDGAEFSSTLVAAEVYGVRRIGVVMAQATGGVLPFLPALPGGGAGALAADGMKPGDALVGWHPGEDDVRVARISGRERLELPTGLDAAAWADANRVAERSLMQRIMRQAPEVGLAQRLAGRKVVAVGPGAVEVVAPDDGARPDPVARGLLGPAADRLAAGDWITDVRMKGGVAVIEVLRGAGEVRWTVLKPASIGTALYFDREEVPYHPSSAGDAVDLVNDAAYNLVVKSVLLIPRLFRSAEQGGVDPNKALTGPIGIFRELKARAELMGFDSFLKVVAMVGLNLFIVNLLPIPITDGGQLLMLGVETVIRRPLPMWLRNGLMWLGVGLVGALFIYICGLDILRWLGLM